MTEKSWRRQRWGTTTIMLGDDRNTTSSDYWLTRPISADRNVYCNSHRYLSLSQIWRTGALTHFGIWFWSSYQSSRICYQGHLDMGTQPVGLSTSQYIIKRASAKRTHLWKTLRLSSSQRQNLGNNLFVQRSTSHHINGSTRISHCAIEISSNAAFPESETLKHACMCWHQLSLHQHR